MKQAWHWLLPLVLLVAAAGAEDAPPAPPEEVAGRPLEDFQEMLARPLFSNTRRPARTSLSQGVSLDEQQLRDTWRLVGIVLRHERQMALFRQRQGGERQELEVGQALEDAWVLESIASDHVMLVNNQSVVQLLLREPGPPPAAPGSEAPKDKPPKPDTPAQAAPPDKPVSAPAPGAG